MPRSNHGRAKPVVLIIRDGWGYNPNPPDIIERQHSAIALADTPIHDRLAQKNPWSLLHCSGEEVGLPPGQMGNSEVGHLNIGSGRIVYQDFVRINRAIEDGSLFENETLRSIMDHVRNAGKALHLIGLCSDGGVHSHEKHTFALLEMAKRNGLEKVYVHCLTDGRDTPPSSGAGYVQKMVNMCSELGIGRVASVIGRYFAMDRDNRWDRVEKAYAALVRGEGRKRPNAVDATREWYGEGTTDEFIPPTLITDGSPEQVATFQNGDGVLFFNFRGDRVREIIKALVSDDFAEFKRRSNPKIRVTCLTEYDATLQLPVAFEPEVLHNILAHVLADAGLTQYRISETEKYPHVTYFFNGGVEPPVNGEERFLIPSPKVATYDLQPEMSAFGVTEKLTEQLRAKSHDFYAVNFANGDMVGHTGSTPATIQAIEAVDRSVGLVLDAVRELGGAALITSDHGNAECMVDENNQPHTAHTTNPVDITYVGPDSELVNLRNGTLADVAPTILDLLNLPQPQDMTGKTLFE
ncbi:2,3-bisphosphoglycerate-independent phosphoglycerate mutase [Gemmatimonadota bacterium]